MATVQARALFDFESGGPGELSFYTDEVLTVLRQDIGAGWWEAANSRGTKGLVPESYLEITCLPEPSIPPPPPPTNIREPVQRSASIREPVASSWQSTGVSHPSVLPQTRVPPQPVVPVKPVASCQSASQENSDCWDDDWDDDDDNSSTTTETPDVGTVSSDYPNQTETNGTQKAIRRNADEKSKSHPGVRMSAFNRFSNFTKSGGDAYLFDTNADLADSEKKVAIIDGPDGPMWKQLDQPYQCAIKSPKKESKFRGMKTYIAYQLTPTFSNIQVSRRYKHFDWLQQRLVEKFSTIAIPPLPEKQIAGRFEEDFVTQRLQQLQLWMDRMCQHPTVAQSDVFTHFLTCTDDKKWKVGKRKAEKDDYQGGKFFLTVKTPFQPLDSKQADQQIEKFGRFVRSMDDSIKHLYSIGENNAKKHQGPFKKEFQKIGGSFVALAKSFEFDDRQAAQNLTKAIEHTGRTYDEIGMLFEKQPQNDMYLLMEGLHEYKGLLSTLPDALMVHRAAQAKIQEFSTKLSESELQSVQSRADVIAYSILAEMEHYQRYRVSDFSQYLQTYLQGQIAFYQQITAKLEETLQQYQRT